MFSDAIHQTKTPAELEQKIEPLNLKSSWTSQFPVDRGAPPSPITLHTMESWTEFKDPGVRYFSGIATYHAIVEAPDIRKGGAIFLHLTDVREVAQIRINGQDAGTVWAPPYTLQVDQFLHAGDNNLEIEVTNLWPNRIIGDHQPGISKSYTNTNITKYTKDSPLLPSGLIGPIEWIVTR